MDPGVSPQRDLIATARLLHDAGQPERAISLYIEALSTLGDGGENSLRILLWLASAFCDTGQHDEAIAACRFAIRIDPDRTLPYSILAGILLETGKTNEAAAVVGTALTLCPEDIGLIDLAAGIALARGRPTEARGLTEASLARNPANQRALSHLALALIAEGDAARAASLLDFDRLVQVRQMPAPPGFGTREEFDSAVAAAIAARPELDRRHLGKTLVGGARLHDTFVIGAPFEPALRSGFTTALLEYEAALGLDPGHPVVRGKPDCCEISSWANVMTAADFELPHIHDGSWVSGVYYPEIPGPALADDPVDAGAIAFGGHDFGEALQAAGPSRVIRPEPGMLVMFPSYIYHRTVPFRAEGRRISIAFVAKAGSG